MTVSQIKKHIITLYRGEARPIPLTILQEDGSPYNVSTATEIVVNFLKEDRTLLTKTLSGSDITLVNSGVGGQISVDMQEVDSASLMPGELQNFEGWVTIGGDDRYVGWEKMLNVRYGLLCT